MHSQYPCTAQGIGYLEQGNIIKAWEREKYMYVDKVRKRDLQ
jgi:hypothetical protein